MASPRDNPQDGSPPTPEEVRPAMHQRAPGRSPKGLVRHLGWVLYPAQLALVATVYFGAGKLGLTMAFVAEQVTAVWPPTGIALAVLLIFGYRTWPAIALGAFLANATTDEPLGVAAGIALGNTLEALVGAWLLRRLVSFDNALERVKDVFALVVLGAGVSTVVSATIGTTTLCLAGLKPWAAYPAIWNVWWLGDAMGDLVVAPLLLTWAGWRPTPWRPWCPWRPGRVAEAGALLLGVAAVNLLVFTGPTALVSFHPLGYTVFAFVIWAALRFGQPVATLMTFVGSSIAIWGTVRGHGPFAMPTTHESLILLLIFMGVVAITTLVLAAVTIERERAKETARQSRDELRLTLAAVQQSYNLLHAVIEGTTDAVFVKDRQGRYLMINTAGARFLGKTAAEVIGKDDTEEFSWVTAGAIMEGDRRIMATGEVETYEDVGTASGVTRTYLSTKGPYRDGRGNIIGVIGISRDITERKRAEERFRLVVESAPCGMLMVSREGRIVLVNAHTETMFGYNRGDLLGQPVELLMPNRFRSEHRTYRTDFFANPETRVMVGRELYGRRRNGSEFPVEIGLTPIEMADSLFVLAAIADITERKQAEESLKESYNLLRAVTEGTTDAVFVKDRQGRYLMINTAGARFLGKAVADVIGKDDRELFSSETARTIMEGDHRIMATGKVETYEDIGTAAGVTRTYLSTKGPYRDAKGRIAGVMGISRDISERKRAEERFQKAVESAPSGMLMVNGVGRIVLVNVLTEKMFGYSRDELLGQPVELLVPDRFRTEHAALSADFIANPVPRVMGVWREVSGRRRDGSEIPLEIRLTPIQMENSLFVLAAMADITERKRAEEMRARLAAIVESSEDAILSKDLDGIILTWNRGAETMYGYSAAEAVGRPISLLVPPERAGEVPAILEQLKRGERVENFETVRLRKDGARIEVALNVSPLPDASGRVAGASVIGHDISERKQVEERLAAVHAVTAALARSDSPAAAAAPVLEALGATLRCDLGVFWRVDAAADVLRCAALWHAPGIEGAEFELFSREITFARSEGLPGRAWATGEPACAPDAPFPRSVAARRMRPCGALAFPVRNDGDALGVLEFFSPGFRQPDAGLLTMVADLGKQIAQFIEHRHAEMELHARKREFRLARTIQQNLLPKAPPVLPGFEIAGATYPAQETGGDYFEFIPMQGGKWGIAIGDASGHGIGAALLIAATRAYLRALTVAHSNPGQVLHRVNQRLVEDVPADHFVTLFLARLNPHTRALVYSSAGHLPGYVLDGGGEVKVVLPSTGVPLGVDPGRAFPIGPAVQLEPGDLVFLLSDGIVEASSGRGPLFGIQRTLEVVRAHRCKPPGDIIAALVQEARAWSQGPLADDMTVIVLKTEG